MRVPKHVIQVYHNVVRYGPDEHTAAARRELMRWNEVILSKSGTVEDGTVIVGREIGGREGRFASCELVVLNDYNSQRSHRARSTLPGQDGEASSLLDLPPADRGGTTPFEIFGLRGGSGGLDLYLRYSDAEGWIGRPRRGDFKLADLRPGEPVRVCINGKTDFSASGRLKRLYVAAEYILEYLGSYSAFEVRPEISSPKRPPVSQARLVDLTEVLY